MQVVVVEDTMVPPEQVELAAVAAVVLDLMVEVLLIRQVEQVD